RLEQILFSAIAVGSRQKKILRASVEIESCNVGRRHTLNRRFFGRRDSGAELLCNLLRDFALNTEYVIQIAIVFLRPDMRAVPRIDQLRVEMNFVVAPSDTSF